jgi:pyridoxal phosphate enzyme (YggS family)
MIARALAEVRERIETACAHAGREAESVTLLAVTKTQPRSVVEEAVEAGLTLFGENRVQEAVAKYRGLLDHVQLHLIGHLQTNKAKLVPGVFTAVESIDSLHTASELSRRVVAANAEVRVLMQFNSSLEATKYGYTDSALLIEEAHAVDALPGVTVCGVMTIGPFTTRTDQISSAFKRTRDVYDELQGQLGAKVEVLSMGMSNDYEIAVREGSTEVRLGTVLFGARS